MAVLQSLQIQYAIGIIMSNLQIQVNQVINEINDITELLYQQKAKEGYALLNNTIGKIMNIIDSIYQLRIEREILFDDNRMINNLKTAMEAMEKKDNVMLADILSYEIAEQLKESIELF
ncbi:MAG: hypothetical protein WCD89_17995 [Anaerocolumna sp.]